MARPLRIAIRDGLYHVTSRGLERRAIVQDDVDRRKWFDLLDGVASRRRWRLFAYALMTNHWHLFVQTPEADLSAGMHDLNAGYVSAYNRRHRRTGPLLQGRFKAILVERAAHEWELSRYIHLNPVRAALVSRPQDYRWSSCRFYFDGRGAPPWLAWQDVLRQHGRTLRAARRAYARYLAEGLASPPPSPLRAVVASTLLGSTAFVARVRSWLEGRLADREVPAARQLRATVGIDEIETAVCTSFAVPPQRLRERGRHDNDARAAAIYLSRKFTGTPMVVLGSRFGGVTGQAAGAAARRLRGRLRRDRRLRLLVQSCEEALSENFQFTT